MFGIFQILVSADKLANVFEVDFYFDDDDNGSAWEHGAHILPLVRCHR